MEAVPGHLFKLNHVWGKKTRVVHLESEEKGDPTEEEEERGQMNIAHINVSSL